jgi:hypothetical protein
MRPSGPASAPMPCTCEPPRRPPCAPIWSSCWTTTAGPWGWWWLGDLNGGLDAATTQLLQGPPGSEIGTPGFARPDGGDGQRLWNLAPLIPEAQRFTRVFRGRGELIDHVLVSHFLVTKPIQVTTAMAGPGRLRSITENPRAELGKPGSDHAAVVASFDLPT